MPLYAEKPKSDIPPVEAGPKYGICVGIIDLGTQYSKTYNKESHQVMFIFELPKDKIITEQGSLIRTLVKQYGTLSIGGNMPSNLSKDLCSWRKKQFTDAELEGQYNLFEQLGKSCQLDVIVNKNGRNRINSVSALMDGMEEVQPESDFIQYSMADNGWEIPANTPDWIVDIITKSKEFQSAEAKQALKDREAKGREPDNDCPI